MFGLLAVLSAIGLHGQLRQAALVMFGVVDAFFLLALGLSAWVLLRWALPGRPIVTLDAAGLHLHAVSYCLPWAELAEVRLFPIRYSRRRNVLVAFVPAQPEAVVDAMRLSRVRRRRALRALRIHGTPLTIDVLLLDHTEDQITAAVGGFAAIPVRRYD